MFAKYETFPLSTIICCAITGLLLIILIICNIQTYTRIQSDVKMRKWSASSIYPQRTSVPTTKSKTNNMKASTSPSKSPNQQPFSMPSNAGTNSPNSPNANFPKRQASQINLDSPIRNPGHITVNIPSKNTNLNPQRQQSISAKSSQKPWDRISHAKRQSRVVASVATFGEIFSQYSLHPLTSPVQNRF